jgi:segregation and condensation protein A
MEGISRQVKDALIVSSTNQKAYFDKGVGARQLFDPGQKVWVKRTALRLPADKFSAVYEGPFDLLLHLILKEQVDLYEVPLARIVDAYLVEVERMQAIDLDVATEFLMIASTLVELKARRLLPGRDDIDLDDELALWEERDLLLARLLECKTFKDVASVFSLLVDEADRSFPRQAGPDERFAELMPDLLEGTHPRRLQAAYLRVITPKPVPRIDLFHVAPIRLSVADAMAELIDELPRVGRISFARLTGGLVERLEVIVRFLALLELFKQGAVDLDQAERFGDIDIVWNGLSVGADEASATIDDYDG